MKDYLVYFLVYFAVISVITSFITVLDKFLAKKEKRRVPEKTLFLLALLGGAFSEYITMRSIRHKTLHKRFMIGLPLIIILQLALVILLYLYLSPVN